MQNNWVRGYAGMGSAIPHPHPLYPQGTQVLPYTYLWVKFCYQTLTLQGKNPQGRGVMGTHCHR